MRPLFGIAAALGISVVTAAAQDNPADLKKFNVQVEVDQMLKGAKIMGVEASIMGPAVKGSPYQADEIHETTQVLADGTRIHNESKTTVYRDSQGRVRRESPGQVMIWDPSSGISYMLNQSNQTAQKMQMAVNYMVRHQMPAGETPADTRVFRFPDGATPPAEGQRMIVLRDYREAGSAAAGSLPPNVAFHAAPIKEGKKESLGMQIVEGLACDGTRTTNSIDAGVIGNDRPIVSTEERWCSPDLQVAVTVKRSDPRTGEDVTKLTNVRRVEPDASLFTVPSGYQMK